MELARDLEAISVTIFRFHLRPGEGWLQQLFANFFRPPELLISTNVTIFTLSVECISPVKRNFYGRVAAIMTEQHRYFYIVKPTNEKDRKEKPIYFPSRSWFTQYRNYFLLSG